MTRLLDITRRGWLRSAVIGIGAGTCASSGWLEAFAADAAQHPERARSVILLWLNGGPATIDLWDLKPGHANGGQFRAIETNVGGIRVSEHLPRLARLMDKLVLVRSMSSKEGDHGRATQFVKTGYAPQGAIQFPALGSILAHEVGDDSLDLPGFVSIAPERQAQAAGPAGGGFLGPRFAPLVIGDSSAATSPGALKVADLERPPAVSPATESDRVSLLAGFEERFRRGAGERSPVVLGLQAATARALRLMRPQAAVAFELEREPDALRDAYGRSPFGQGCLLARRLVERGVACVEVTLGGWDTHQNNFAQLRGLSQTLDTAFAALLEDLNRRGLLDSTLIVCHGEFGRTPKINTNAGRDHWPRSWASVLAGGGIRSGQVIGRTGADGTEVEDRPVSVPDLIATVCRATGIDPMKQNISNVSRPIRVADPSARPIVEVL